jgi:hypothetical protein
MRNSTRLGVDLSALDSATMAHQATLRALVRHLRAKDIVVRRPERGAPDAGGASGRRIYIAEIKSLKSTNEDQEIRLGLG